MPYQWYRHVTEPLEDDNSEVKQPEGFLRRLVSVIMKPWEKVKHYGKALVGGTIYYYGNRIFWGGETSRYLYKRYRTIFQRMGFVRQAILAYKHRITAEIPKVLSSTKEVMAILDDRLKHIGLWDMYGEIAQDLLEFGDFFGEIVYSVPDFRVIGLKRLEPDYMYIQRDPYGRVLLYISVIDGIPVTIEPYRMLHIKLDPQPGDAFGVGLIEGGMDDLAAIRILEDLNIQLVKHNIYPHRVYVCPSDDVVAAVEKKLQEQRRFGDLVVPNNVKVQQMQSGTGIDLRGFMLYYQQKFFLDVGVPMDMLIKGTGANRSTAAEMSSAFNGNAKAIQREILVHLERFCELILASEGIVAPVRLLAPEIDKALEFARRKEIRELYQEGLISRDFAQELLELKHPLNQIKVPENFTVRLNQEKNWMEQFKLGLLTRPYAIKLLGHDVPENRPQQPQRPNFMMPMPGMPPGASPQPGQAGGVPLGQPDDPEMVDPNQVQVVAPGGLGGEAEAPAEESQQEGAEEQQAGKKKLTRIGLQNIRKRGESSEELNMGKSKTVDTIYVRRVGPDGKIETAPYEPVDVKAGVKRGHVAMDTRREVHTDKGIQPPKGKPAEVPLKPTGKAAPGKGEAVPVDGAHGGIHTEPRQVPVGERLKGKPPVPPAEPTGQEPPVPEEAPPPQEQPPATGQGGAQPGAGAGAPMPPGGAPMPGQPPAQQPQIPGYFNPGQALPKFADIFGDNEYSIRRPQKHIERIREELVDAFGQKHRRVHERTREHHKPGGESDFITKKKAAAQRRWMKRGASSKKLKQGQSPEEYVLAAVDLYVNREMKSWTTGVEELVLTAFNTTNDRIVTGLKEYAGTKTVFSAEDANKVSEIVANELMEMHSNMSVMLSGGLRTIYSAGVEWMNTVFAASVSGENMENMLEVVSKMFRDRSLLFIGEESTKAVEGFASASVPVMTFVGTISKILDIGAERGKTLLMSAASMIFQNAVKKVLQHPSVAMDVDAIEFIAEDGGCACKSCSAHNYRLLNGQNWDFESCSTCDTFYRIHIADE